MPDFIGRIPVPEIAPSTVYFPITPDYGSGVAIEPDIRTFQFGSGNTKIEQRFVLGNGYRKFTVRRSLMNQTETGQLADFWELNKGAVGSFLYAAPDGNTYTVRFADQKLTFDYLLDDMSSLGVILQELPTTSPEYRLNAKVERFPTQSLADALLDNVQTIIPLIRIRVLESQVPDIFISDRRVAINDKNVITTYQPRLMSWDGIRQSIDGSADQGVFSFGNADRVFTKLANDTSLWLATLEFSLYHVGSGTKIDLWAGNIQEWSFNSGPEFRVTAFDGIYELGLPYPTRKISRTCWKIFKGAQCPYAGGATTCDKSWATCKSLGMNDYFGGIIGNPQTVFTKDNSTGVFGFGRNSLQSSSVVSDSIYSEVLPDIWYHDLDHPLAVNAKIVEGRDEGDFFCALGVVGRGPLGSYTHAIYDKLNPICVNNPVPIWHTLDGQPPHGPRNMGLRQSLGHDPVQDNDPDQNSDKFSLGQGGAGIQTYDEYKSAGTAFVEIRRTDDKGLQLQPISQHQMRAYVSDGLAGLVWTSPGHRLTVPGCNNPIWVAVNCLLMAKGLWTEDLAFIGQQEALFDVDEAIAAAAICDEMVAPVVARSTKQWQWDDSPGLDGDGNPLPGTRGHWEDVPVTLEKQFVFNGGMQEQKPLRQWLSEILTNCLGYFTFSFGKIRFGVRYNSDSLSAFTIGNIVFNSLEIGVAKPEFNRYTATFGDVDYDFAADSVSIYDAEQAQFIGGPNSPVFLDANTSLSGTTTRSQAARIVTARLREEVGGVGLSEQKKARKLAYKTTVLALDVHPGMVCSLDHDDLPDGHGEFRILSWKLNPDYSIDIEGRTTTDSMYNRLAGPQFADVKSEPVPTETVFPPADLGFRLDVPGDGTVMITDLYCGQNGSTVHQGTFDLYFVPEDQSALLNLTTGMNESVETLGYNGAIKPIPGEWILIGGEAMEVVSVTATDDRNGTCTVKRGQFGTTAVAHGRVGPATISNISADNQSFDVTGSFHPGDGLATDVSGEWSIIGSYRDGRMTALWPFTNLTGQKVYSDPSIYRVVKKSVVIPFAPRFFTSGTRASYAHKIELPNAGIVSASAVLENTRGDRSEPAFNTYTSSFPFRSRTGGNPSITLTHPVPPQGMTENAFLPVVIPASQPCRGARAEWKDILYLPTPSSIGTVTTAEIQSGGSITLTSSKTIPVGTIQVSIGDEGDSNRISAPATWTNTYPLGAVVTNLTKWLNDDEQFQAFFIAQHSDPASNVVTIIDRTGRGGTIIVQTTGDLTATATGLTAPLGVKNGRRYAATFSDGTHESSISQLSASTGPTGGATKINLKDLPSTSRADVTTANIYAAPDGQDSPLFLVGSVPAGTAEFTDETTEAELSGKTKFTGSSQPVQDGKCTITVRKDGNRWFVLQIQNGSSTYVDGLALSALPEGAVITADVDNTLPEGELSIFID